MTIRYTPEAMNDLRETKVYIRKVPKNPKAAARISRAILDACARLKEHPQLGISLEARTGQNSDLRYLVIEKYIALYRIDGNVISVARILDGRQDYMHILFGEDL